MIAPLIACSPLADESFALESVRARAEVMKLWPIMEAIDASPNKTKEIQVQATAMGRPFKTIHGRYYKWVKEGRKWETLINRVKFPAPGTKGLPEAFIQHWKSVYEQHQRDTSGMRAHAFLLAQLTEWERDPYNPAKAIPGYDTPPLRDIITKVPEGWHYKNLIKKVSNAFEKSLRRQGPKAASAFLPSIYTSRTQLAFGQLMMFDDSKHDTYNNLVGINSRTLRPLSFNVMEALSSDMFELGLKPQIDLGDHVRELDSMDFFWFVMHVLTRHGYNAEVGTLAIFEWGTANVDKKFHFDEAIAKATNGAFRIDRSGKFGDPAMKDMLFGGQPAGNFRFKALLESFFNLVRNWHAMLPGATGRNPEKAPEESYGLKQYNDQLSRMIEKLPPEKFLAFQRPVLEWEDYVRVSRMIHDIISYDRNHNLEGWEKLGFIGHRYRLSLDSNQWMSERDYLALPPEARAVADHLVCQPGYFERFKLSRREVFLRHRHLLKKLPMSIIPSIAPDRAWRNDVIVADNLEIRITDASIDSEPLIYRAKVRNEQGHEIILERGKNYRVLINVFDPDVIWIAGGEGTQKGSYIGTANRVHPACKLDWEGYLAQQSEINHIQAVESAEVKFRMNPEAAHRVEMYHHNKKIINGPKNQTTPEERDLSKLAERALARGNSTFYETPKQQGEAVNDDSY